MLCWNDSDDAIELNDKFEDERKILTQEKYHEEFETSDLVYHTTLRKCVCSTHCVVYLVLYRLRMAALSRFYF